MCTISLKIFIKMLDKYIKIVYNIIKIKVKTALNKKIKGDKKMKRFDENEIYELDVQCLKNGKPFDPTYGEYVVGKPKDYVGLTIDYMIGRICKEKGIEPWETFDFTMYNAAGEITEDKNSATKVKIGEDEYSDFTLYAVEDSDSGFYEALA